MYKKIFLNKIYIEFDNYRKAKIKLFMHNVSHQLIKTQVKSAHIKKINSKMLFATQQGCFTYILIRLQID